MATMRHRIFALLILAIPNQSFAANTEELPLSTDGSHLWVEGKHSEKLVRQLAQKLLLPEEYTNDSSSLELIEKIQGKLPDAREALRPQNLTRVEKNVFFAGSLAASVVSFEVLGLTTADVCIGCPDGLTEDGRDCLDNWGNVTDTGQGWKMTTSCVPLISTLLPIGVLSIALLVDASALLARNNGSPFYRRMWHGLRRQYWRFFIPLMYRLTTREGIDQLEGELQEYARFLRIAGWEQPAPDDNISILEI